MQKRDNISTIRNPDKYAMYWWSLDLVDWVLEEPKDACMREIFEELHYTITEPILYHINEYENQYWIIKNWTYIENYDSNQKLIISEWVPTEFRFWKDDIQKLLSSNDMILEDHVVFEKLLLDWYLQ